LDGEDSGGAVDRSLPHLHAALPLVRLGVVVHDFDGDAMQIGKKTGVVVVRAQVITVNAG